MTRCPYLPLGHNCPVFERLPDDELGQRLRYLRAEHMARMSAELGEPVVAHTLTWWFGVSRKNAERIIAEVEP